MAVTQQVLRLAERQGGYVNRAQLLEGGMSASSIDRRVGEGEFRLITPGVYRVLQLNSHLDLLRGASLALPDPVVSHHSAAHLLRFPKLPILEPTVLVASHTTHQFPGVTVRRCDDLAPTDLVRVEGLAVTSVSRTTFDLAGILSFEEFDEIAEGLVVHGRLSLEAFDETVRRLSRRGKRGSRAAQDFLELRADGDKRATALERRGRAVLAAGGLPDPIAQYAIPWRSSNRFDDAYPEARLAIEWDSRLWHQQRVAMAADRRRDREAAANGWIVIRVTWEDIEERPDEIVDTVRQLLVSRTTGRRLR